MKKLYLWILLITSSTGNLFAQSCLYDSVQQYNQTNDPQYLQQKAAELNYIRWFRQHNKTNFDNNEGIGSLESLGSGASCANTLYLMPVVFHIMQDASDANSSVADTIIKLQLRELNKAFANAYGSMAAAAGNPLIQFVLAKKKPDGSSFNGINRFNYTDNEYRADVANNYQRLSLATYAYYPPEEYINIWIVKDIQDGSGNPTDIGGYSTDGFTGTVKGIVMRYSVIGDTNWCNTCGFNVYSKARTLAHEMGHYFNLKHPFTDACDGGVNAIDCAVEGDLCCDTRPMLKVTGSCTFVSNSCPSLSYYNGLGINDNLTNIMGYTDDECIDHFTEDQISLMHSALHRNFKYMFSPANINSKLPDDCVSSPYFTMENSSLCSPDSMIFTAYDQDGVSYKWEIINGNNDTVLNTITSSYRYAWYCADTGNYKILLKLIVPGDTFLFCADRKKS